MIRLNIAEDLRYALTILGGRASSHNGLSLAKTSRLHSASNAERKRVTAEIAKRTVHSLEIEAMEYDSFISDDKVHVSELLSKLGVCCDVTRAVFCGRYEDLELRVSCLAAVEEHSRSRRASHSVQFLIAKRQTWMNEVLLKGLTGSARPIKKSSP